MPLRDWVRLPREWIESGGLSRFKWNSEGSDNLAALMVLAVIAHHADDENGIARLTYSELSEKASLSREKVSAALRILRRRDLIVWQPNGRSSYGLANYNQMTGWAKFPAKKLYANGAVDAFVEFRLRRRAELDAMKLYFLFAARRSRQTNLANISYDKIEEYTGMKRHRIRPALTVLGANGLIHVERLASGAVEGAVANAYRLSHLDSYIHMGTAGRRDEDYF